MLLAGGAEPPPPEPGDEVVPLRGARVVAGGEGEELLPASVDCWLLLLLLPVATPNTTTTATRTVRPRPIRKPPIAQEAPEPLLREEEAELERGATGVGGVVAGLVGAGCFVAGAGTAGLAALGACGGAEASNG